MKDAAEPQAAVAGGDRGAHRKLGSAAERGVVGDVAGERAVAAGRE